MKVRIFWESFIVDFIDGMISGWKTNEYLPRGWFWKMWEGETRRQKLDRNLFFVSREGVRLESFKQMIEFMEENSDTYSQVDIEKILQYKKAEAVDLRRKTYEWEEGGESLPPGWMRRTGRTQEGQEQERILSPEGEQFRSRFSALQNLVKQEAPRTEIEQMKALLVHEGFQASNLLPPNWLYKRISESTDSAGRISTNSAYITDSGELFESVKSAIEYLQSVSTPNLEKLVENFKEFQARNSRNTREKREDWQSDDTVPKGWKRRIHESGKEFILGPDGKQFFSRTNALLHLYQIKSNPAIIKEMKSKMFHDGWKSDSLIPANWLKKIGESKQNGRVQRSYKFFSREGSIFESHKLALEFIETNDSYSKIEVENFKKFIKKDNPTGATKPRAQWEPALNMAPQGWRTRVRDDGKRIFRMPDGGQFQTLLDALQHMVKNDYDQNQVRTLRGYLKSEGWEYDGLIPIGCQIKYVTDNQSSLLGKKGEYFDNIGEAVKFMSSSNEYTEGDLKILKSKFENSAKRKSEGGNIVQPPAKKLQQTKSSTASNPLKRKSNSEMLTTKRTRNYVSK